MVNNKNKLLVRIVMGSKNDWPIMKHAGAVLKRYKIEHDAEIVSAHRTPHLLSTFCEESENLGVRLLIAGAGGAAHLPGMIASFSSIPVIGVPITSKELEGIDSLLSIAQMPYGVPVATMSIGVSGAKNAGLFAASILGISDSRIQRDYVKFRRSQTKKVLQTKLPPL